MRAVRSLKTLRLLSDHNPNLLIAFCDSGNYPQFPKKLLHTPHSRFTSSTGNESTVPGWYVFPNPPPPVDSPSGQTPYVITVYDPATCQVVAKREHDGSNELDSGSEKDESKSSAETGSSRAYGDIIGSSSVVRSGKKKKGRSRSVHVCSNCGFSDGQWWGTCKQCGEVGTMKQIATESAGLKNSEMKVSENAVRSWLQKEASPIKLTDVYNRIDDTKWRISLPGDFGAEVDRVLGGGLVPGSLVLVGGDPGIGKSTLLLQIAGLIAEGIGENSPGPVIYVSGEESVDQIGNRALRLCLEPEGLYLLSSTDIEDILVQAQRLPPKVLIIDSIQTVYLKGVNGSIGSVMQVKECTSALVRFAKKTDIPVLLIGHVTKTGDIAGPRVLEHIVDVVLYLEGEKYSSHRLLRSVKNRFGSTDELGVFKMSQSGLQGLLNPSEIYLAEQHSDSDYLAGLAVTVIIDGSRAFLIEVQALCSAGSSVVRHLNGVRGSRADMIIQVIIKQAGLDLQGVFINVISGVSLAETAGDLAIAAAICSSFLEFPIPYGVAFIAEVGLAGELRMVPQVEKRINTLAKLGYKKCIVPKLAVKSLSDPNPGGMEVVGCSNLKEMINSVFR